MKNKKSNGTLAGSYIGNKLKNNSFAILSFIVTAILTLFIYFCFDARPFGDVTILRMDLYHQYGPLFAELYDRVTQGKSLLYSWSTGLGSSFLGNFFNYLSSTLTLVIILFGHVNMPDAIGAIILLKGSFAAAFFCYYLRRSFGRNDQITAAFGVLYAFCGYFIAYYWNVMWLDAMAFFPLVLLGIERIINQRKATLYIIILTLTILCSYYMSYMVCLFSVLYFVVYYISNYSLTDYSRGINKYYKVDLSNRYKLSHKIKHSRLIRSGLLFGASSLLAACIAAFCLIPVYYILQTSAAITDTFPKEINSYFSIFNFLANHLASLEPTIRSSGEDVLPNVYCGMATVILVPLYLFVKSIPLKEKIAHVGLLAVLYYSFNINIANFIWHGLHFPNDLPYRFSFMYSIILLIMAYKAVIHIKELKGNEILCSGIGVVFFIIAVQEIGSKNVNELTVFLSLLFTVLYTFILICIKNSKLKASTMALVMLVCVVGEVMCCDSYHYSMSQTKLNYAGDYNDFRVLKKQLDEAEGNDSYRMELTELRTRMDPAWYGYNGVSTFSSMAYEKLSNLQNNLGMMSNYINSYTYNLQTPVYNAMMSLKYIVENDENDRMSKYLFSKRLESGKFTAYENKYYLPIAYLVDSNIKNWSTAESNPFDLQSDFFEKATGVSNVFTRLNVDPDNVEYNNLNTFFTGFDSGYFTFEKTVSGAEASFTLTVTPKTTQNVYIYASSDEVEDVYIDGSDFSIRHDEESNIIDLGICKVDEPLYINIPIKNDEIENGNVTFYAYGLQMDKFIEGYDILEKGQINISTFEDAYVKGTVNAEKDGILYTSIPYDPGWSVKVDGKPINSIKIADSLLAINLSKGEHTIEFRFMPQGLILGCVISSASLLLFIVILLVVGIKRKRRKKTMPVNSPETDIYEEPNGNLPPIKGGSYDIEDFSLDISNEPKLAQAKKPEPAPESKKNIYIADIEKPPVNKELEDFGDDDAEITVEKYEGKE
ncbi:MAG: YfhO family protein [Clostridiales bacterium]|nr:YfhO family protein [Clostridiales bacterium]